MSWFGPRVYAVTNGNKLINSVPFFLTTAQLCFGIFSVIKFALGSSKFLDRFFVRVRDSSASSTATAGYKLRCVQTLHL